MARTRVDLANLALSILVRDPIRNFDGGSPEQIHTGQFVEDAIQFVAGEFQIPAARTTVRLVSTSDVTFPRWDYVYIRPADVIRIWEVTPLVKERQTIYPYEETLSSDPSSSASYICSNVSDAYIRYSSTRVDLSRLTPHQFELAAYKLAERCCMPLKKDKELLAFLGQEIAKKMAHEAALVYNSEAEASDIDLVPEFIGVRWQ